MRGHLDYPSALCIRTYAVARYAVTPARSFVTRHPLHSVAFIRYLLPVLLPVAQTQSRRHPLSVPRRNLLSVVTRSLHLLRIC